MRCSGRTVLVAAVLLMLADSGAAAPKVEQLACSTSPTGGAAVTVYVSAAPDGAAISTTVVAYTTGAWAAAQTVVAAQAAGVVYTAELPGFAVGVTVAYTAVALALDGMAGYGPTSGYAVAAAGSAVVVTCRLCAANTTSGNYQAYESAGIRIFQGLRPDIVGIQEFNYRSGTLRDLVDTAFGTGYYFFVEPGDEQIPNGVVSRWPIKAAGQWDDPLVSNRDYAWATIDVPGPVDLHMVSVHLLTDDSTRPNEATNLSALIAAKFPATDYVVLAGDLNTDTRSEQTVSTLLATPLSDAHKPADQAGDQDTSAPRSKPYDYVLPNAALDARHVATQVGGRTFADGLVYDSRVTVPYTLRPTPILAGDSGVAGMQHMAVVKDYALPVSAGGAAAPELQRVGNREVYCGDTLAFGVTGMAASGASLSLSCSESSRFTTTPGAGTAYGSFSWTPLAGDMGDHAVVFTAESAGTRAQEMINISVLPEPGTWFLLLAALTVRAARERRRSGWNGLHGGDVRVLNLERRP